MIEQGGLRIEVEPPTPDGQVIVRVRGELDMEGAPALEAKLIELITGEASSVIVDLGELRFIDSTGLQCLLAAAERARVDGEQLALRGASGQVADLLRLTEVAASLPFAD